MSFNRVFFDVAAARGDSMAVVDARTVLTYSELQRLSTRLATRLRAASVRPGSHVPLVVDRSAEAIVGLLGIAQTGGCYVPIEWTGRDADLAQRLADVESDVVVTTAELADAIPSRYVRIVIDADLSAASESPRPELFDEDGNEILYTIFTSGSTGKSKGVEITRANLLHYATSLRDILGISAPLHYAFVSSLSADLGNTSIFLSLLTGGCLHLIDDATRRDPRAFQRYVVERRIEALKITPSHFAALFNDGLAVLVARLRYLIFGGEKLSPDLVRAVFEAGLAERVVNHYGPTETTVGACCFPMAGPCDIPEGASTIPIGWPIGATRLELVAAGGQRVPFQGSGELLIGGPLVGRGYYNAPALTAERFVELDLDGQGPCRFYRTGDMCRRSAHGWLEFVGRIDRQVKIRGFRVEPEMVEVALIEMAGVAAAAVIVGGTGLQQSLGAALMRTSGCATPTAEEVLGRLKGTLPEYMVPSRIVFLEQLPTTTNGKVDYRRLAEQVFVPEAPSEAPSEALSLTAQLVADLWRRYLNVEHVALSSDFFRLGGDSVVAIQLISSLQSRGFNISARQFFESPTLGAVAALLEGAPQAVEAEEHAAGAAVPKRLAPIQEWFFTQRFAQEDRWTQAVLLESAAGFDPAVMAEAAARLAELHPCLRTAYIDGEPVVQPPSAEGLLRVAPLDPAPTGPELERLFDEAHSSIDLRSGRLVRLLLVQGGGARPDELLLVCHHLAIDAVSWRILVDDLARLYTAAVQGRKCLLPRDLGSYWSFTHALREAAQGGRFDAEDAFWDTVDQSPCEPLPVDHVHGPNDERATAVLWHALSEDATTRLQREVTTARDASLPDILLSAFLERVGRMGVRSLVLHVENHGRDTLDDGPDVSRTVGWFTALFPLSVTLPATSGFAQTLAAVQRAHAKVPHSGAGYGVRAFLRGRGSAGHAPDICFNYLGQFSFGNDVNADWTPSKRYPGAARGLDNSRVYLLKLTARIVHRRLVIDLSYSRNHYRDETMRALAEGLRQALLDLVGSAEASRVLLVDASRRSSGLPTYCPEELDLGEPAPSALVHREKSPHHVLLTGVTGFLGIYLLAELLERTDATISCLIRSSNVAHARSRLMDQFRWYFPHLDARLLNGRVRILVGDITASRLGLSEVEYEHLSRRVDMIFHAAADIRLVGRPEAQRLVNVEGTRNMVALASRFRPKEVHHLSTLSVAGCSAAGPKVFCEDDGDYGQKFLNAYEETKLQAEAVIRRFAAAGGRAYVYRTGSVTAPVGASVVQRNLETNRIIQSMRDYILTKMAPILPGEAMLLSQVDVVTRGIVALALDPELRGGTFHVASQSALTHDEFVDLLVQLGFSIERLPAQEFIHRLKRAVERSVAHEHQLALALVWASREPRNVTFDCRRTEALLNRRGIRFPPTDADWLARLVDHCNSLGVIDAAPRLQRRVLQLNA